jgi:hypothetical protein
MREWLQLYYVRRMQFTAAAAKKKTQDDCPHLQGCLGPGPWGPRTCIIWHTFEDDIKHPVGICNSCQRIWRYTDSDYAEWFRKPSCNTPSTGGLPVAPSTYPVGTTGASSMVREVVITNGELAMNPPVEPPIAGSLKDFVKHHERSYLELKEERYEDNCGDAVRIDL